jgi:branched-chain amino acid transport system ATP-binding protein
MSLSLEDVVVRYGRAEALKGISLEVPDGAIVALIGGNGAGKTTALRAISGLVPLGAGRITLDGQRLDRRSPAEIVRVGVGHAPEGRRVFPRLTVLDNLKTGAYLRRDRQAVARDLEEVFARFPILQTRRQQLAGTLSGGEQQMLAIGRALMARPRVLLLDEPSLGLAPQMIREIWRAIADIHRRGTTILVVEQYARMALRYSTIGYVLETGRLVLSGPSPTLLEHPAVKAAYLGG